MKRMARIAGGFALLIAGIVMIVLPGPGWLTIAGGLALLAQDFVWARRALDRVKHVTTKGAEASRGHFERLRRRFSRAD